MNICLVREKEIKKVNKIYQNKLQKYIVYKLSAEQRYSNSIKINYKKKFKALISKFKTISSLNNIITTILFLKKIQTS